MSTARVRPNHQITIPKELADKLHLEVGDILEAEALSGKLVLVPQRTKEREQEREFSPTKRKMLARVRHKIDRIRSGALSSRGLTLPEAALAVEAGLVASDQRWWWLEDWQRGERQAERNIQGQRTQVFADAGELIRDLRAR